MTLLQRQQYDEIDQDRRRKEESLLLLLLLLCEEARHAAIHAAVIGASVFDAIRAVLTNGGMPAMLKAGADDAYTSAVAMAGQLVPEIPPVPPSAPPDTYVGQVNPNALVDAIVHRVAKGLADGEALTATSIGDAFDAAGVTIDNPSLLDGAAETQVNAGYQPGLFFGWVADPNVTGLEYVSVIDDGTTKICRRRNGVKLPKDDPWWLENVPPMHYGCRSTLLPLTGPFTVTINPPTFPPAQPGFGLAPFGLVTRQPALAASRLEAPTLNLSTDDEGEWRTINGVHVMIDKDGIVRKGPANLVGMHHGQIKASGAEPDIAANHAAAVAKVRARKLPGQASAYGQAVQHGLFGQGATEHSQASLFVGAGESSGGSRSSGKKAGASAPLFGETASTGAQGHLFAGKMPTEEQLAKAKDEVGGEINGKSKLDDIRSAANDPRYSDRRPNPEMAKLSSSELDAKKKEYESKTGPLKNEIEQLREKVKKAKKGFQEHPDEPKIWEKNRQLDPIEKEYAGVLAEDRRRTHRASIIQKINAGHDLRDSDIASHPELLESHGEKIVKHREQAERYARNSEGWDDLMRGKSAMSDRQKLVVDATRKAMEEGGFYKRDVDQAVASELRGKIPEDELAARSQNVEGGDFGMDVYRAQGFIRQEKAGAENKAAAAPLHAGVKIGKVEVDGKTYTSAHVTHVSDDGHVKLTANRGGRSYTISGPATTIGMPKSDAAPLSAPVDPSRQFGLFAKDSSGQPAEIGEKAGQADLFNRGKYKLHAPTEPTREVVGSANASDPKHTGELPFEAPKMQSAHGKSLDAAARREPMADARGTGGGQAKPNNEVSWTSKSGKKFKVEVGDNQLNVFVDGKHLGSAFPHNLKSADHPENASLRSALLASGNTHAIVSGKMGIGVPANEAAKIQSAIAEAEAGNSVPREHQRLKDALGAANDRLKAARERAHQSDGVGHGWHHAKASEQAADAARSALRDFESTHNLARLSFPTLNLDRAEEGDGHWVTIEDAHVFIGKGGTIEKGPAHLTGKKIGDLPPRSKAMDASDHHHAARESMRKAGIAQSAGDYKGAQRHANNALKHSQASNELKAMNGGPESAGKSAAPSRPTLQSAHGQSLEQHTAGPVPVDQEVAAAAKSGKLQAPVDTNGKINPHLAEAYARHAERQGLKLGEFETRDGVATASVTRQNAPSEPPEMQSDHGKMLADTQAALVSLGVKRAEAKQLAEKAEGATASERTANALRLREGTSKHSVSSPKPAAPTTSEPGNEKSQEQHRSEADERINSLKKSLPGIGEHLQNRPVTATFHSGEVFDPNGNPAQGLYHRSPADGDSIDIATGADFSKTKGKNLAQNPSDSFVHEIGHHLQSQIGKTSDPGNREWQDIYESKLPDEWAQSVSPYGGSKAAELFSESLLKKSDPGRFGSLPPEIDAYLNKHLGSKSVAAPSEQPSQASAAGQANAKATNGAKAPKVGKDTTRSAMEKELVDHHEKVSGAGTYSADDEQWINSHSAGDPFKYHGEMPGEIKGMIADNPALRNKFSRTENRKEAGFEDAYGADPKRYEAIANSIAGNPLKAAIETAKKSNDPMMPLKAAILETTPPSASALQAAATRAKAGLKNVAPEHRAKAEANVRAMQERAQHAKSEAVGKEHVLPEHLQQGDTFKINGHPVTVTVDEDEHEILQDHGTIPDTPIEAIRGMKLPIDKGSLKHEAASAPVHQHDDSIPFSRVFAPRPLELILSA